MFEYVAFNPYNASPEAMASELTKKSSDGWEVVSIVPTFDGRYCAFLRRPTGANSTIAAQQTQSVAEATTTAVAATAAAEQYYMLLLSNLSEERCKRGRRGGIELTFNMCNSISISRNDLVINIAINVPYYSTFEHVVTFVVL